MNKSFILLAVAAFTLFFTSCDNSNDPTPTPTPKPTSADVTVRFYTSEDMLNLANVAFLGKYNGSPDFVELQVTPAESSAALDSTVYASLDYFSIDRSQLRVYTFSFKADTCEQTFKMHYTRNAVEDTAKTCVIVGARPVSTTTISHVSCDSHVARLKVGKFDQTYIDKYINNDIHNLVIKL